MILLPVAVVWTGYLLFCYGYGEIRGGGIGFTDWLYLSRVGKVVDTLRNPASGAPTSSDPTGLGEGLFSGGNTGGGGGGKIGAS